MRWASVLLSLPPKRLAWALVGPGGLKPRQQPEHLPKHKLHHGGLPNRVLEPNPGLRSRLGRVPRPRRRLPRPSPGAAVDPLDLTTVTRWRIPVRPPRRPPPAVLPLRPLRHAPRLLRSRSGLRRLPRLCLPAAVTATKLKIGPSGAGALPHRKCLCVLATGVLLASAFFDVVSHPAKVPNLRALRTHSWRFGCDLCRRAVLDQMAVASGLPLSLGVAVAVALHVCRMQCLCFCLCARLAQHSFRVFHSISSSITAGGLAQKVPVPSRLSIACARLTAPRGPVQGRLDLLTPLSFHSHHQSSRCAVTCHTGVSPAGPKSGTSSRMCLSPRWLGALLFMTLAFGARGARVAGGVATPAGAEQRLPAGTRQSAKHSDEQVSLSGPRKWAFRRAQNRATRDGATWYRGRWLTRQQLQAADGRTLRAKAARPAAAPLNAHKHARTMGRLAAWPPEPSLATGSTFRKGSHQLSVFSLNIGSFTTEVYDEFCRWLELPSTLASIDVIFVQETWRGSSDYQLPGWSWIASGQKPLAGQGVAVLVNRQLVDSAAIWSLGFAKSGWDASCMFRCHFEVTLRANSSICFVFMFRLRFPNLSRSMKHVRLYGMHLMLCFRHCLVVTCYVWLATSTQTCCRIRHWLVPHICTRARPALLLRISLSSKTCCVITAYMRSTHGAIKALMLIRTAQHLVWISS